MKNKYFFTLPLAATLLCAGTSALAEAIVLRDAALPDANVTDVDFLIQNLEKIGYIAQPRTVDDLLSRPPKPYPGRLLVPSEVRTGSTMLVGTGRPLRKTVVLGMEVS